MERAKMLRLAMVLRLVSLLLLVAFSVMLLMGCGHNTGVFTLGTRISAGLDPQGISYEDGLNVIDMSRENSCWDIQLDEDNGVSYDAKTGNIKGIKRLRREIGPQITGRLVELAKKDPEMARLYIEAMKNYWEYKKGKAGEKQE